MSAKPTGAELINLYHLARTALANAPPDRRSNYDRMLWAAKEFSKLFPDISENRAYKELSRMRDCADYQPRF